MSELLLDRAGRRRSPATMPGFHAGRPPRNKGLRYPADPPKVGEIVAVMRAAGDDADGRRLRGLIAILWRAGLRIQEALDLSEADLDQRRGELLVRRGKEGRRREVGMDGWGWEQLQPWLELRLQLPVGPLLCVINGPTRGRHWASAAARTTCAGPPPADDPSQHIPTALIRGWRDAAYRAKRRCRYSAYGGNPAAWRAPSGWAKDWTRTTRPSRTVKSEDRVSSTSSWWVRPTMCTTTAT
jgi:integrase